MLVPHDGQLCVGCEACFVGIEGAGGGETAAAILCIVYRIAFESCWFGGELPRWEKNIGCAVCVIVDGGVHEPRAGFHVQPECLPWPQRSGSCGR